MINCGHCAERTPQAKENNLYDVCNRTSVIFNRGEATILPFLHSRALFNSFSCLLPHCRHLREMALPTIQFRILFNPILMSQQHEILSF